MNDTQVKRLKARSNKLMDALGIAVQSLAIVSANVVSVRTKLSFDEVVTRFTRGGFKRTTEYHGTSSNVVWFRLPGVKGASASVSFDPMVHTDGEVRINLVNHIIGDLK